MQTIGERLEEARKRKGISIREAAEATKIRGDYLHKYENNQFDIKLPEIYVRGFLRTYATYLKLPADKINNDYLALGLSEAAKNGRAINREVYGRMDIGVASAKTGLVPEAPSANQANAGSDTPGDKNPATFRPRAPSSGLGIPPDLLVKYSILLLSAIVLVFLLIWGISAIGKSRSSAAPAIDPNVTWVKPQASDRNTIGLVGAGPIELVTVTDANGAVLYRGALKPDDVRPIPRNGQITIQTETPQYLLVEIGGTRYPLKDKRSSVKAP